MDCGDCTACCTLLDVFWMDAPPDVTCSFCDKGCTIHETKDDRCKEYSCAYHQADKANIAMRPDNCGVIYERVQEDIMFGTMDTQRQKYPNLNAQVKFFLDEGFNVVLARGGTPVVHTLEGGNAQDVLGRLT